MNNKISKKRRHWVLEMRETSPLSDKSFDDIERLLTRADELVHLSRQLKAGEGDGTEHRRELAARGALYEARELLERYAEHVPGAHLAVIRRSLDTLMYETARGTRLDPTVLEEIVSRIRSLPSLATPSKDVDSDRRARGSGSGT